MTHYNLNRIIVGIAAVYAVVILAAVVFGPTGESDESELAEFTPGYVDSESGTPTPHTGVGGVSGDDVAVSGTIVDASTGDPIDGVSVTAIDDDGEEVVATTGADGRFELPDVSGETAVTFSVDGYGSLEEELGPDDEHVVELEAPHIEGRVINANGSPVRGATVAAGDVYTRSIENGKFRLEHVSDDGDIIVKAAGYQTKVVEINDFDGSLVLESESLQALFAPANLIADEDRFEEFLEMVEESDVNAVVVDVKDALGRVHYDTDVELAHEIGAVTPNLDLDHVLLDLAARDIQAIARVSVFEDPALPAAQPELGINDSFSEDLWRTWQGDPAPNPYREEVWDYNIALIQELADYGFDEVQLAAVRFPDNGLVNRADFGQVSTARHRRSAIADFLDEAYAAIAARPARLSADIFAMSLWDESNNLNGQDLMTMAERVDYLNPRLFPSDFESGSLGFDDPSSEPFAMVGRSLESGQSLLPRHLEDRIRPWLQAFSYGPAMPFGEEAVRQQIGATERFGATGWMLWNPDGDYDPAAITSGD